MNKLNELSEAEKLEEDNLEIQRYFSTKLKLKKPLIFKNRKKSIRTVQIEKNDPQDFIESKVEQITLNLFSSGRQIEEQKNKIIMDRLLILKIRNNLGLTQEEFGNLIGVDRRTIINYEQGRKIPTSKIKQLELLLEKGTPNNKDIASDKKTVPSSTMELENLQREILYLKDHIKTLKDFLDEKNKITEMYTSEIKLLRERIVLFNNKE